MDKVGRSKQKSKKRLLIIIAIVTVLIIVAAFIAIRLTTKDSKYVGIYNFDNSSVNAK